MKIINSFFSIRVLFYLCIVLSTFLLIYLNPSSFVFRDILFFLYALLIIFPFILKYIDSKNLSTGFLIKIKKFFIENTNVYFILSLLIVITIFTILNQKTHSIYCNEVSVLNGVFTLAGSLPLSDNYGYYADLSSFLDNGKLPSIAMFRPLSTLFMASLYYFSGRDFIVFSIIINLLFVISILYFSIIVYRYFGLFIALFVAFFLSIYAGLFINTFLTEIPGLIIGLFSFSFIIESIYEKNFKLYIIGIILLCLAFQMRAGLEIFVGLLCFGTIYFFKKRNKIILNFFLLVTISLLIFLFSSKIVLSALSYNNELLSNLSLFIYKIYKNSESWTQIYQDFPSYPNMTLIEQSNFAAEQAKNILFNHTGIFVKNYFNYILNHIVDLPDLIFPFSQYLPISLNLFIFLLFLLIPILNNKYNKLFFLGFLLSLSILIFLPIIYYLQIRVFAVTMPLQILIYSTALFILVDTFCKYFFEGKSPLNQIKINLFEIERIKKNYKNVFIQDLNLDDKVYQGKMMMSKYFIFFIFFFFVIIIPIIIDRIREHNVIDLHNNLAILEKKEFLLSPKKSIYIKVINDSEVQTRRNEIPLSFYSSNDPLGINIKPKTYVFNAYYYNGGKMISYQTIYVNEDLFNGKFIENSSYLLKGKEIKVFGGWNTAFLTDSLSIIN
jgi:hypothetical protein